MSSRWRLAGVLVAVAVAMFALVGVAQAQEPEASAVQEKLDEVLRSADPERAFHALSPAMQAAVGEAFLAAEVTFELTETVIEVSPQDMRLYGALPNSLGASAAGVSCKTHSARTVIRFRELTVGYYETITDFCYDGARLALHDPRFRAAWDITPQLVEIIESHDERGWTRWRMGTLGFGPRELFKCA